MPAFNYTGRVVQVDSIKIRVESAYGFGACRHNMMKRFQNLLSDSTCVATQRRAAAVPHHDAAQRAEPADRAGGEYTARLRGDGGMSLHSSTCQLNLSRFGHTSPCPPI